MTTAREAGQILGGETLELALRINGMGDEEAALVLDARMCILEDQWKRSFVERGLILLEFEERNLWSLLTDPDTNQPYPSLRKWIKRIAPPIPSGIATPPWRPSRNCEICARKT